jgi:hypothetical protein
LYVVSRSSTLSHGSVSHRKTSSEKESTANYLQRLLPIKKLVSPVKACFQRRGERLRGIGFDFLFFEE